MADNATTDATERGSKAATSGEEQLWSQIITHSSQVTSDPQHWGGMGWTFLLYVALNFPNNPTVEQKNNYRAFYQALGPVLPCVICRNNYAAHLNDVGPPDVRGRRELVTWLLSVYNTASSGQPTLSVSQFMQRYLWSPHGNPEVALGLPANSHSQSSISGAGGIGVKTLLAAAIVVGAGLALSYYFMGTGRKKN